MTHTKTTDVHPDLMTLEELADRCGMGRSVAYALAKQNKMVVPAIRMSKRYYFSRPAFEAKLAEQHESPSPISA